MQKNQPLKTNVDISFKELLSPYDAPYFYGSVYPYFEPIKQIKKILPSRGFTKRVVRTFKRMSERIPELAKYLMTVALSIIAFYLDFFKDIIIATEVSFLYNESESLSFKNLIVIVLWVTVFLSHITIGTGFNNMLGLLVLWEGVKLFLSPVLTFGDMSCSYPPPSTQKKRKYIFINIS